MTPTDCQQARPSSRSASSFLRNTTADVHRSLEAQLPVMSGDLTVDAYGTLLAALAGVHRTLDGQVAAQFHRSSPPAAVAELEFESRRKSPALANDLSILGRTSAAPAEFAITTLAGALGAVYVCEGATLGGRLIAPRVHAVLGPELPVSYFRSYGVDVPRMWAVCRRVIDRLLVTDDEIADASATAVAVFELFGRVTS
jgi:heme oxygenase